MRCVKSRKGGTASFGRLGWSVTPTKGRASVFSLLVLYTIRPNTNIKRNALIVCQVPREGTRELGSAYVCMFGWSVFKRPAQAACALGCTLLAITT
jgi:hypothetical protein